MYTNAESPSASTRTPSPCAVWTEDSVELIRGIVERIGDRWSMIVLLTLRDGPMRYSDLRDEVPGISHRMLTLTLRQLQRDGQVTRTAHREVPPRVEYALTELSETLLALVIPLVQWAGENHEKIQRNRETFDEAKHSGRP
ncbi:helix-turn-helix domain-containing protein [soil metagenome]